VASGGTAQVQLGCTVLNQFSGSVSVAFSLPSGYQSDTTSPASINCGTTKVINLTVPTVSSDTSNSITFTATAGSLSPKQVTVTIKIKAPSADFTLTATAESDGKVVQGGAGYIDVNTAAVNGFSGQITLTCTADPGITFDCPTPFGVGVAQTVRVNVASSVAVGSHTLTFTATSTVVNTALTHTQTVSIMVTVPADFTLTGSLTGQFLTKGQSQGITISTNSTTPVSLTVSGLPTGMTVVGLPASVIAGQDAQGQITDNSAAAGDYSTISINGQSGTFSHTATLSVTVMDNGTQTLGSVDPQLPSWVQPFLEQMWPVLYSTCAAGGASDNSVIPVVYQPGRFAYQGGSTPFVTMGQLPQNLGDVENDKATLLHEFAFASLNRLWLPPFDSPPFGLDEGFAQACTDIVSAKLIAQGVDMQTGSAGGAFQSLDTLRLWTPSQFASDVQPQVNILGEGAWLLYLAATVPAGTNPGDWTQYDLSAATESLLSVYAAQGTTPTPAQLLVAFDQAAGKNQIDGMVPSVFLGPLPYFSENTSLTPGTFAFCSIRPLNPAISVTCASWKYENNVVTNVSVPVTLAVNDTLQNQVIGPINGTTNGDGYIRMDFGHLPPGGYTLVSTFQGATPQVQRSPFLVVPSNLLPADETPTSNPISPGTYFVTIDAAGNAVGGTLTITGATIVWETPGGGIVDAQPSGVTPGVFTINGRQFTQPRPWWRVIFVPAQ
jgi:hypothetical protein